MLLFLASGQWSSAQLTIGFAQGSEQSSPRRGKVGLTKGPFALRCSFVQSDPPLHVRFLVSASEADFEAWEQGKGISQQLGLRDFPYATDPEGACDCLVLGNNGYNLLYAAGPDEPKVVDEQRVEDGMVHLSIFFRNALYDEAGQRVASLASLPASELFFLFELVTEGGQVPDRQVLRVQLR